jgi:hypothetical protein
MMASQEELRRNREKSRRIGILMDALGDECSAYFFAWCHDTEMCLRHPWRKAPCMCTESPSPANVSCCDNDLSRIRNNDDIKTGVSLAERQERLGECMQAQLRKRVARAGGER